MSKKIVSRFMKSEGGQAMAAAVLRALHSGQDLVGRAQLLAGREPTVLGTSRVAVEQWKRALEGAPAPGKGRIVLAAVRNARWVEWAVFSACYLLRLGYRPTILFSEQRVAGLGSALRGFWARARKLPHLEFLDLDPLMPADLQPSGYDEFARDGAHTVAAYDLRVEEHEGGETGGAYEAAVAAAARMLQRWAVAAERALSPLRECRLVCPSGLIGETMALLEVARRLGQPAVFVEAWAQRPGHLLWNLNRPALEFDIEGWMTALGAAVAAEDIRDYMTFREGETVDRKGWLDDFHQVQRSRKGAPLSREIEDFFARPGAHLLLGTNVVGDSATLRRATIFRSQRDWIDQVTAFVRAHPELNLVIRVHPDELWANARLRMAAIARRAAAGAANILVIGSDDDTNTFSLMEPCVCGTAWVSNFGLDMALRGKPVVMAARAKYTGLGVVLEPATREEYFDLLLRESSTPRPPSAESIRAGQLFHQILFRHISLPADSRSYQAHDYRIGDAWDWPERRTFYRILSGELPEKIPATSGSR